MASSRRRKRNRRPSAQRQKNSGMSAAAKNPSATNSRYKNIGADVILPKGKIAGKSRAQTPSSDQDKGATIRNEISNYSAFSIDDVRDRTDVHEIIKTLLREEGVFSSAGTSMVSLASNTGVKIAGFDMAGNMDIGVMSAAWVIFDRLNSLSDYSEGYNDKSSLKSLVNTLMLDVVTSGGCGLELVLDPDFSPNRLVPVNYSTVTWQSDGDGGRYPTQDDGNIDLNIPTVFMAENMRDSSESYTASVLRPGLNATMFFQEFLEDTRRAVNRVGHSRMTASLILEKIAAAAPEEIREDQEKFNHYLSQQFTDVQDALAGLEPEDALVTLDNVEINVHDVGGSKADYSTLLSTLSNLQGASLKTPASVTGMRAGGGQALSNAETLVYLQNIGGLRAPVEEVLSRAVTLALRLQGIEGSVWVEFNPIDLRPQTELEAYKGSFQKRILERLSFGLINDAQACFELGLRPQGLQAALAGTNFYTQTAGQGDEEGERQTSAGRALNPDTPSSSGGDSQ